MLTLERAADALWNPWLLGLFLVTGLWYSVRTGFFQLFGLKTWLKATVASLFARRNRGGGGLSQTQALATALASTIGTGSIAGVATAVVLGGPGAVFWMWVSAVLGMMTGCAEKTLAVAYRERGEDGGWQGGPMCYMARGLHSPVLAAGFCLCCLGSSLAGGNLVQANSIATALEAAWGCPRLAVGVLTALACGAVIWGGVGRIGKVSESLVPLMAFLFLAGGCAVLWTQRTYLPDAFRAILEGAFRPAAPVGYVAASAIRYGVARGVFTNEAGMGSSAMAHAAARVEDPAEEGMWGILEVGVATLLVCTVTALVILTTGVYDPMAAGTALQEGHMPEGMLGAPLAARAFSTVLGQWGTALVAVCLLLFAFTSLVGWSYYVERCLHWLTGGTRGRTAYRALCLVAIVAGSTWELGAVWQLADLWNGLMALPNLLALLLLTPKALELLRRWVR